MKQNREPRNKHSYVWSYDLRQGAKTTQWGRIISSRNSVGKTGFPHAKGRSRTLASQESCKTMTGIWLTVSYCKLGSCFEND